MDCNCFGSSGIVDAHFKMAKRAFVPGENIKFDVEVKNNTGSQILHSHARLIQVSKISLIAA